MVRLEKIVYERMVNTAALGRERKIGTPTKWFTTNPNEHMKSNPNPIQSYPMPSSTNPSSAR